MEWSERTRERKQEPSDSRAHQHSAGEVGGWGGRECGLYIKRWRVKGKNERRGEDGGLSPL